MKTRIKNTRSENNLLRHGISVHLGQCLDIEGEERCGGQEMAAADQLPADGFMLSAQRYGAAVVLFNQIFTAAGGKIGDRSEGDPLFVDVTLPPGWKKEKTEHPLWTHLLDANGNVRAKIFYKAAFYDRAAHLSPVARFYATTTVPDPAKSCDGQPAVPVILDSNHRVLWRGGQVKENPNKSWEANDQARETAQIMLAKCYPDHENLGAYWDVKEPRFE